MIDFVITYRNAEENPVVSESLNQVNYIECMELMVDSIKRIYPEATIYCMTDLKTQINVMGIEVYRTQNENELMPWIVGSQLSYIENIFENNTVIFSPDAILCRNIDEIFEKDFDIGLTFRRSKRCPINNGVIFLNKSNKEKVTTFWKNAYNICLNYPIETRQWWGDQQCLWDLVNPVDYSLPTEKIISNNNLKLGIFPCKIYNATPIDGDNGLLNTRPFIVHFKGSSRKSMMKKYLELLDAKD